MTDLYRDTNPIYRRY